MGLDVRAYRSVELVTTDTEKGYALDEQGEEVIHLYPAEDFAARMDRLVPGFYRASRDESFGFRAGSYIWYGSWREWLANQVGASFWARTAMAWAHHPTLPAIRPGQPFYELIDFSDCEGCIGPETSKKLAKDFAEQADKVKGDEVQMRIYRNFQQAFELASNGGAVDFH